MVDKEVPRMLSSLAATCGTSEPAFRLLLSITLGYPLAFLYRGVFYNKSANIQHAYFALCGMALCYFNYGSDVIHSFGCVLVVYLLLHYKGGTRLSVWIAYIYFMGYLLCGYYLTETEDYDINWTMPHCVLTLRVIGIVVDVYDGAKPKEKVSVGQKDVMLTNRPSLLDVFGYVYFFGGFMAGPQLPMKRYLRFTNGELIEGNDLPNSVKAGLIRWATAICYLAVFVIGNMYVPVDYVLSDNFKNNSLFKKHLMLGIWGKLVFCKYIICWIMAEGSCIVMGITYNQRDENGNHLWNGCANVHLFRFETATQFNHLIQSFNILTNKWSAHYIYKRLQFMGSKLISQSLTLLFLSIWHGFSLGYYCCFALEFACIKMETDIGKIIARTPTIVSIIENPIVKPIKTVLLRVYIVVFTGYCLVPFTMISWRKTHEALNEVYYTGHILFFGWVLVYPLAVTLLHKSPKAKQKEQ